MNDIITAGTRVHRLVWIAAALIVSLSTMEMASARDRPGTPNHEKAYECWDIPGVGGKHFEDSPMVCVLFTNTASEEVKFDTEWMADGVKLSQDDFKGRVACANLPSNYPGGTECVAGANLMGYDSSTDLGAGVTWRGFAERINPWSPPVQDEKSRPGQSFIVRNLEFDTEYCFRFKARNVSNEVVSAAWSNWACARTAPRPPKPSIPTDVTAKFFPAQWNGSSKSKGSPNHVEVAWSSSDTYVGYFEVHEIRSGAADDITQVSARERHKLSIEVPPAALAEANFRRFKVCAHNLSGESCSGIASTSLDRGIVDKPNVDATGMTHPGRDAIDTRPSDLDVTVPQDDGRVVKRPLGDLTTDVSPGAGQSNACRSGYVWRMARPADLVCVTPAARRRIAQENADTSNHVDPAGAYGPNTCVSGYVWRDAFEGDAVCVTPDARNLARQENAESAGHRADSNEDFRDPH